MEEIKANEVNMDEKELNPVEVEYLEVKMQHRGLKDLPREERLEGHGAKLKSLYKRMTTLEKKLRNEDILSPKVPKTAVQRNKQV